MISIETLLTHDEMARRAALDQIQKERDEVIEATIDWDEKVAIAEGYAAITSLAQILAHLDYHRHIGALRSDCIQMMIAVSSGKAVNDLMRATGGIVEESDESIN